MQFDRQKIVNDDDSFQQKNKWQFDLAWLDTFSYLFKEWFYLALEQMDRFGKRNVVVRYGLELCLCLKEDWFEGGYELLAVELGRDGQVYEAGVETWFYLYCLGNWLH